MKRNEKQHNLEISYVGCCHNESLFPPSFLNRYHPFKSNNVDLYVKYIFWIS